MSNTNLRRAIAVEAARLMLRQTETNFFNARTRAARWLVRGKVASADLPSNDEIQAQIYVLTGLFQEHAVQNERPAPNGWTVTKWDRYSTNDPETYAAIRLLLDRLEGVSLDPRTHPEGDALYHSLQVFEMGRDASPYDEEFLWACLLHDVGVGIDRRNPVPAAIGVLRPLVTDRTLFLVENLEAASDHLVTGHISRSLRSSEHFEELVQLARFDRDGRVPGALVPALDNALEYLWSLDSAWDDA